MERHKEMNIDTKYLNSLLEDEDENENLNVFYKNTFIYAWGKNKYGELGLGHTDNTPIPRYILVILVQLSRYRMSKQAK